MKKILFFFIILILPIIKISALDINSKHAILYNLNDNTIIYEKDAGEKTQVASLTKIVTAITVIDNIVNLDELVTIRPDMLENLDGYAKAGLEVGDMVSYIDLLYALMLPSGADAALALALSTSDSLSEFVNLMNEEVNKIGVTNSHFSNPIGMDDVDNYSTAYDLAQILKYSLDNEIFKKIYTTDSYEIKTINKTVNKTTKKIESTNVPILSLITGSKTGYTDEANFCFSSIATINDVNYLLITLNSEINYIQDTIDIYDYYSTNYSYQTIISKDSLLTEIKIKNSHQKYLNIYALDNVLVFINNSINIDNLEYRYTGIDEITENIKVGDLLGHIDVVDSDNIIYTYDIYLTENISYYHYSLYIIIASSILLILILILIIKLLKQKLSFLGQKRYNDDGGKKYE